MSAFVIGFPGAIARDVAARLAGSQNIPVKLLTSPELRDEAEVFVRQVDGDISILEGTDKRIDFGLSGRDYLELADQVTAILHLKLPGPPGHPEKRSDATAVAREIVELGQAARSIEHIVVLSHVDVAGTRAGGFAERDLDLGQGFSDASQESRFRLERILRRFMRKLPVTVVRSGWIVGEGKGLCPLGHLLLTVDDPSSLPVKDPQGPLYVVDAQVLVQALVGLASSPPVEGGQTLHLLSQDLPSMMELVAKVQGASRGHVPPDFELAIGARRALRKDESIKGWSAREFFKRQPYRAQITTSFSRRFLSERGLEVPPLDSETIERLAAQAALSISHQARGF